MTRWEQAKIVLKGFAYLATGCAIIFGVIIGLGIMIDALAGWATPDTTSMPLFIELMPLLIFCVGLGWGAFFIYKSYFTAAHTTYQLIGKAGYHLFQLRRIPTRKRRAIGGLVGLVGLVMVCVFIIPAIVSTFPEPPVEEILQPSIAWLGVILVIVGLALSDYKSSGNTEENENT